MDRRGFLGVVLGAVLGLAVPAAAAKRVPTEMVKRPPPPYLWLRVSRWWTEVNGEFDTMVVAGAMQFAREPTFDCVYGVIDEAVYCRHSALPVPDGYSCLSRQVEWHGSTHRIDFKVVMRRYLRLQPGLVIGKITS